MVGLFSLLRKYYMLSTYLPSQWFCILKTCCSYLSRLIEIQYSSCTVYKVKVLSEQSHYDCTKTEKNTKNTWSIYHNYLTINESLSIWCSVTFSTVVGVQRRNAQLRLRSLHLLAQEASYWKQCTKLLKTIWQSLSG